MGTSLTTMRRSLLAFGLAVGMLTPLSAIGAAAAQTAAAGARTTASAAGPTAEADAAAARAFIEANAPGALATLSDPKLSFEAREAQFGEQMAKFTDLRDISQRVLPRQQALEVRNSAALSQEWSRVFRAFAVATYHSQLDTYRGQALEIRATQVLRPGDVVVRSQLVRKGAAPFPLNWRLFRYPNGGWKVRDVGLVVDNQVIWLADFQREEFRAYLQSNGQDMKALIGEVQRRTTLLRTKTAEARSGRRG